MSVKIAGLMTLKIDTPAMFIPFRVGNDPDPKHRKQLSDLPEKSP